MVDDDSADQDGSESMREGEDEQASEDSVMGRASGCRDFMAFRK
jgi:hypothetical protein